ncbi:MAG: hypothetical protein K0S56_911 [Microvirga sp.]|jgi:hypothetical protein|nr:hypothetical protein [Microvirga sp.]
MATLRIKGLASATGGRRDRSSGVGEFEPAAILARHGRAAEEME